MLKDLSVLEKSSQSALSFNNINVYMHLSLELFKIAANLSAEQKLY
jgi:hypothetical protein